MTTIRIDSEVLEKAHDLGLNVSKIAENALKDAIDRMERPKTPADSGNLQKVEVARDGGFEPPRPFDHRLSRPAPYQAWGTPHAVLKCCLTGLRQTYYYC